MRARLSLQFKQYVTFLWLCNIHLAARLPADVLSLQVDIAVAPGVTVQVEILPGHVASISELKSGFLSIHKIDEVTKQFISSGFAFARSNSFFEIFAVEAVIVEQIDPASLQKGLAEFTQKLSTASADA